MVFVPQQIHVLALLLGLDLPVEIVLLLLFLLFNKLIKNTQQFVTLHVLMEVLALHQIHALVLYLGLDHFVINVLQAIIIL